jgi:hypothetical protein
MDVDGGFDGGFDVGFISWFHLAVLGYQPQQSICQLRREAFTAINQEGLMGLSLNELVILQTCFTGSSLNKLVVLQTLYGLL